MASFAYGDFLLHAASWLTSEMTSDDWASGPRPPSFATVRGPGPSSLRLLLCGGGPAVGYGVSSHELSLAGHLARQLAGATGHGIDLDVAVATDVRCRDVGQLLAHVPMGVYDAVFLSAGVQDVLDFMAADRWSAEVARVVGLVRGEGRPERPVFVMGVPEVSRLVQLDPFLGHSADRRAAEFNGRLQSLCDAVEGAHFVPFLADREPQAGRHRTSGTYEKWAKQITAQVAPVIRSLAHQSYLDQDERARQLALDSLHILDTEGEAFFDEITSKAQRFFGVLGAGLSFIDHDRQWFKSTAGIAVPELPREVSLCDYTIKTSDGFVVEDATRDPRFADSYFVAGAGLRFYAGVPVRDPHGYMVGALCVFDNWPRSVTENQMVYLQGLVGLIEEHLLQAARPLHQALER